jgi:Ni/Fe-hydrogenase subunit HybB-like protein
MALDPSWYSTLFGAYFFVSSFYLGLAAIAILAVLAQRRLGLEEQIGRRQFHDLGKLLFGFCLVTGNFFWSQFVVIWYGNLPEETAYLILRGYEMPWAPLTWTILIVSFIIPFLLLLSRRVKESPRILLPIALVILIGMWIERYILVVPSLWHQAGLPFGWIELLITGGFLAAVALSYSAFLSIFPFSSR